MLFNSKIFVVFLTIVLLVYYQLSDRAKIGFLLLMSYVFYGYWTPELCSLIALSTVVDFWCGRNIAALTASAGSDDPRRKKWLYLSLAVNLGMLGFFKYADFFIEEFCIAANFLGFALTSDDWMLNLVLPVGISFYTFQTMAYTIDIYRGKIVPEKSFWRFALYVSFFPQLVAGPVERAEHLLPQFSRPFRMSREMVKRGVFLILLGFVKKVIIADRIARIIEPYYEQMADSGPVAAATMLLFTCQIYVDFSSYSDIAIGLGLLLGYNIRANFNLPFVVPSIPERWRRWHLSMSHWFRDYIFIPLGGSRKGTVRTQLNIMIVMFLSGLWHGASNNFVVWGLGNGLTMVGHKLLLRPLRFISTRMNRNPLTKVAYYYLCCWNTFCMIATINIFFRCPDWPTAKSYVSAIFLSGYQQYLDAATSLSEFPVELIDGAIWTLLVFAAHESQRYLKTQEWILAHWGRWAVVCMVAFWAVITFGIEGPQFIYYQF
ncbi:MAG: MBOAT family O-acyltransferase [Myxococcota bacterium]|nr:MBOAT family O-acyltransferase [Myxococcota bacterium]